MSCEGWTEAKPVSFNDVLRSLLPLDISRFQAILRLICQSFRMSHFGMGSYGTAHRGICFA
jgi:hypothetical protein